MAITHKQLNLHIPGGRFIFWFLLQELSNNYFYGEDRIQRCFYNLTESFHLSIGITKIAEDVDTQRTFYKWY